MSSILAVDLGKFKSVACIADDEVGSTNSNPRFRTIPTTPKAMHDLLVELEPRRLVIETGAQAGWISDLCVTLGIPLEVANTNDERWRWKHLKRKTDRDDALRMAQLSIMGQLPTVHVPGPKTRAWRSLIAHRHTLVGRRTAIKNSIRSILDQQGLRLPSGKSGWTKKAMAQVREWSAPMDEVDATTLWRGELHVELTSLEQIESLIQEVESKLNELADSDERVQRLRTIPGVGPRLSETIVAVIDDPHRFRNGKQVGAYAGLVPRQFESGMMQRSGRITGRGNRMLRSLLVEVAWLMRRYNHHLREVFDRVCRGSRTRRKIAVVATARRLLVICWAMLRDGTEWKNPEVAAAT